ncbi:hypothetical protein chiPu_0019120 [Chiloscyllium punctatum]|uniref:Uncharacterized protein n=1 Tax=Chiloscyllium punctatum TaxID=137246 RepID=A0A401RQU0_CHIPU|nr:hypothetical protein [Chiloscyllium punctatum]
MTVTTPLTRIWGEAGRRSAVPGWERSRVPSSDPGSQWRRSAGRRGSCLKGLGPGRPKEIKAEDSAA